ncbi:MAG: peptidoglycan D,D-transpeptidase FtsI family protein [Ruminiclostridium sp.]
MSKISGIIRTMVLVAIIVVLSFLCVIQLMRIQIVEGSTYAEASEKSYTANQTIQAARGQISDVNGVILSSNKTVYKVIIQKAFFTQGSENTTIARTLNILKNNSEEWIDELPITMTEPYKFTGDEATIDKFKAKIDVNVDATVENCINALINRYNIDTVKYDSQMVRYIAGVRYQMEKKDFSYNNRYIFAEDVSKETVISLKEQSFLLGGIDIVEEPTRVYLRGSTAPHVLGTIGAISEEKYAELRDEGYSLNDTIGTNGIEKAMESVLRGENGVRTITRDSSGSAISDEVTQAVQAGNSVKLTIDAEFQDTMQEILENQINWLHYYDDPNRGNLCDAGAAVVLNAKTGAVLAMVNYPTYDLNDYVENYSAVLNAEGNPLYNRAINGLYRPGSTFKTITGSAGLISGLIDRTSQGICNGVYTYYSDYQPKCTGYHYGYTITDALKVSCNIFFYDLGRRMGIEYLADFASKFGIGTDLGLEIGGSSGRMTTPELYEKLVGTEWTPGNTLQAAIGQSETLVTPLHLAVQAMTLANNGVRYKPYLVDSVWNYDMTEMQYKTQPVVVETINDNGTDAFETVREGMIKVSTNCTWPIYAQTWIFDYLPYSVAIKTGTAQVTETTYNSTICGYYPAEDPQIAFGIVLEKGEFSRYMIRNIIDAYFYDCYEPDLDQDGNVVSPWKRWTEEKTPIR